MTQKHRCAFTICARNYLAQAFVLAESFANHCQDEDFFIYLVDDCPEDISADKRKLIRQAKDLFGGQWEELAFRYDVVELSTSVKPFVFEDLLKSYGQIVYLDPDIKIFASLEAVYNELDKHDVVATPHFCSINSNYQGGVPLAQILWVGSFNCGFFALKSGTVGRQTIDWWKERLFTQGYADRADALHVDQKWIDLLPCLLPVGSFYIMRHLGCNVAFWNLHERELILRDGGYYVRGSLPDISCGEVPLLFFHFSGYNPANPNILHQRHSEFDAERVPTFRKLFDDYASSLQKAGYEQLSRLPYQYNFYSNGVFVTMLARRVYRSLREREGYQGTTFFDSNAENGIYKLLKESRLIVESCQQPSKRQELYKRGSIQRSYFILEVILRFALLVLGARRYVYIVKVAGIYGRFETHAFLVKGFDAINSKWRCNPAKVGEV